MTKTSLTVADLLQVDHLRLRLRAGGAGLDREVSWAHTSELEDPTPWLTGDELLMTSGMGLPGSPQAQARYLERLAEARVAGLVVSEELAAPELSAELCAAADRLGLPVLELPLSVPFIVISQEVAAAVQSTTRRSVRLRLQVLQAVEWMVDGRWQDREIFERLADLCGWELYLGTADGRALIDGVPAPPRDLALPAPSLQAAPRGAGPGGHFVLPITVDGEWAGHLVALRRPGVPHRGLEPLQQVATVAGLRLSMLRHEREVLRRERSELLSALLQETLPAVEARTRLARHGFADAEVVLVCAQVRGGVSDSVVPDGLDDRGIAQLSFRQGEHLLVLVENTDELLDFLRGQAWGWAGVSSSFAVGQPLVPRQREAVAAATRAHEADDRLALYSDTDLTGRWLPTRAAERASLVATVLGPALAYDAQNQTDMVGTVRIWLERGRRVDEAAKKLIVHPNTVAYRLRRFGELTGLDLSSTDALATVWLALRAAEDTRTA